MMPWDWIDLLKLLLAMLAGFVIGFERELHHKPAGMATMTIVTLASALMMELSYGLSGLGIGPQNADPARLAAGVLTGIGFLGAGVIIQDARRVQGITTAATIWLMAGVGLAIGAGFYIPALAAVGLALVAFWLNPVTGLLVEARRNRLQGSAGRTEDDQA